MKSLKNRENLALSLVGVLALLSGGACLILSAAKAPVRAWNFEESVEAVSEPMPDPLPSERFVPYVWKFEDFYEARDGRLRLRAAPWARVETAFDVSWLGAPGSRVQVADNAEFSGERVHAFTAAADYMTLKTLFLGRNFWRVSRDGARWSKSHSFTVEPEFAETEVGLHAEAGALYLSADGPVKRFVLEFSRARRFAADATFVFQTANGVVPWNSQPRGYWRARGVLENGELTGYSAAIKSGSL